MVIRVDIDDEEKQVSGVDWSLSWERVGRGWDWRGERRFPSKIAKAKTMILQSSEQRKTQVSWVSSETLPKAQRTRGLSSSYQSNFLKLDHKFKHKS